MDSRAIAHVRASFRTVTESRSGPAWLTDRFYANMYDENPALGRLFPAIIEAQAPRLIAAVSYVVDNLEAPDEAERFLQQLARDHRKYRVGAAHYPVAGRALLAALRDYTGAAFWTEAVDAAWRQVIDIIVGSMIVGAESDELPSYWTASVVGHRRVLHNLAVVRLQSDSPIPYEAGQYVPVEIPQRPRTWRYFSPAIPTNPYGEIEFHVRGMRGGWVSPAIVGETVVGDRWTIGAPLGGLRLDQSDNHDALLIAGGTGIAPLRAQVMEMAQHGDNPRVHLFVGGHFPCDLYDANNMWQLSLSNPWLTVIPVSEQNTNPWWHPYPIPEHPPGMHHRLVGSIGSVVAGLGAWSDRQVQIAGSPGMIAATTKALIDGGTPPQNIQFDPVI